MQNQWLKKKEERTEQTAEQITTLFKLRTMAGIIELLHDTTTLASTKREFTAAESATYATLQGRVAALYSDAELATMEPPKSKQLWRNIDD